MESSKTHVHEHTRRDVASPVTSPLLKFLLEFAGEGKYLEKIQGMSDEALWAIGHRSTNSDVVAEGDQEKDEFKKLIDGPGLQHVPSGTTVTIVGAGISGLVAGYELKRAKFNVRILEASSRVGGRVITFRDPLLAPGLHAEGGAMRIPPNHFLPRAYIEKFNIDSLFPLEMENKFIYLSSYHGGTTLTYEVFNHMLIQRDNKLLKLFPNLKETEKGKTCDRLFHEAVTPVVDLFKEYCDKSDETDPDKIQRAYQKVTEKYDKYTLRSYLEEVADWSVDAIRLYDLANAHVIFENGFIEAWKGAFLLRNTNCEKPELEQFQHGMDQLPKAFISPDRKESLNHNITYGARVTHIAEIVATGDAPRQVRVDYETDAGKTLSVTSDYVIFTIPYTAQRAITKSRPFTPALEQAIRDVRYVEVTKVLLQYQKRWWEKVFSHHKQETGGGLISDLPIRYAIFPTTKNNAEFKDTHRGVVLAAYTFQQDATILGSMSPERRVRIAAENLDHVFPTGNSLQYLETGTSQVFPSDELAGGSAFCIFGPGQRSRFLETTRTPDWACSDEPDHYRVFFAGEHTSYTHGWIHGAIGAALRCVQQVHAVAISQLSQYD
ncbi:hypothetical protein F4805DRAFT_473910 [Annulohypoxylon moriforme]|nr:hypothetical protein F4805DRAFT_473910 [Annulohypoxylon moriforme]